MKKGCDKKRVTTFFRVIDTQSADSRHSRSRFSRNFILFFEAAPFCQNFFVYRFSYYMRYF